ncbi:MAG TPA: GNAT family N-acetyltransferase [Allocoleopsis sp.]
MSDYVQLQQANGEIVTALICPMAQRHLQDFDSIWQLWLASVGADDAFWDWARKKRLALTDDRYEAYALESDRLTQGLIWLETQWHRSQWAVGQPLVYVEALASAPWNRRSLDSQPWLRGVGSALLEFARQRSLDLGYGGRLGLHALPRSEAFYEAHNMLNLGYDSDREMVYFEYGVLNPASREEEEDA